MRTHGGAYLPVYTALVQPYIEHMSHPDVLRCGGRGDTARSERGAGKPPPPPPAPRLAHPACSKDRCLALFVIDDVLEFVGEDAAPALTELYLPVLLRCAAEPTPITAQAAVYGLGAASLSCRQAVLRALPAVLGALYGAATGAAARKDPAVADNATTALAKLVYHAYDGSGGGQRPDVAPATAAQLQAAGAPPRRDLIGAFLGRLPLKHDEEEARVSLQLLCSWIDAGDADVLAGGLAPLLSALAAGLLDRNVVTESLRGRVAATLLGLRDRPAFAPALQAAWAALPGEAQAALVKVTTPET